MKGKIKKQNSIYILIFNEFNFSRFRFIFIFLVRLKNIQEKSKENMLEKILSTNFHIRRLGIELW